MHRNINIFVLVLWCLFYAAFARQEQSPNLAYASNVVSTNIVGGVSTLPGRYPYQVALTQGDGIVSCGGTLIGSEWILSAAHCVGRATHAEIGRFNFSNHNETYDFIEIAFEAVHPQYDVYSKENDIMLIRLVSPSDYDTITVDDGSSNLEGENSATAIGWGDTSEGGSSSDILLEVEIDIVPNLECKSAYGKHFHEENMMCASQDGKDFCSGDDGGPLILKGDDVASDIQVGVISWNSGCAREGKPGVYALVHTGSEFMQDIQSCNYADGDSSSSFLDCCSVTCTNGFYTCDKIYCNCLSFMNDGFDYSVCNAFHPCEIGDSVCDRIYNIPECNYDGGDCCQDTCEHSLNKECDRFFWFCTDPKSSFKTPVSFMFQFFVRLYDSTLLAFESIVILVLNSQIYPQLIENILGFLKINT